MAVMEALYPQVLGFYQQLREFYFILPEPPGPGSTTLYYAHWFSVVNFVLQTQGEPSRPVPGYVLDRASTLGTAMSAHLDIPIIPLPPTLSFSGLGFWTLTLASATTGDNWCQWSPHTPQSHMEIFRPGSPHELEMECVDSGHKTEYEVISTSNYLKKK
jgi:hypothetical protein